MPAYTFFYPHDLIIADEIELSDEESHHAISVMRLTQGEEVFVLNGQGLEAKALVLPSKKRCRLKLLEISRKTLQNPIKLSLLQGLTSIAKADLIVEKLTELGLDEIAFFAAERSGRQRMNEHQLQKLEQKVIGACKQSGRLWLPTLKWYESLEERFQSPAIQSHLWITLDPLGKPWRNEFPKLPAYQAYTLVVGPESGLSPGELELLSSHGAKPFNIHPHILRAETAAVSGACLLEHYTAAIKER